MAIQMEENKKEEKERKEKEKEKKKRYHPQQFQVGKEINKKRKRRRNEVRKEEEEASMVDLKARGLYIHIFPTLKKKSAACGRPTLVFSRYLLVGTLPCHAQCNHNNPPTVTRNEKPLRTQTP